jgi:ribonuclease P protein component
LADALPAPKAAGGPIAIERLKHRAEFLKVADARRKFVAPGFVLQARPREDTHALIRVGFTASRKVGGSVVRNRARRRLREAAARALRQSGRPGHDYVVIARQGTLGAMFTDLVSDLARGLDKLAAPR